jgi:hypothetical protein
MYSKSDPTDEPRFEGSFRIDDVACGVPKIAPDDAVTRRERVVNGNDCHKITLLNGTSTQALQYMRSCRLIRC